MMSRKDFPLRETLENIEESHSASLARNLNQYRAVSIRTRVLKGEERQEEAYEACH